MIIVADICSTLFGPSYKFLPVWYDSACWGWSSEDLQSSQRQHHLPDHDIYGAMFFHVRDLLIKFHRRISNLDITFTLSAKTAQEALASKYLKPGISFDRIDTSNIADKAWCGIDNTLKLGQHLNPENPKATLFTYFMHVVNDLDDNSSHELMVADVLQVNGISQQEIPVLDLVFQWIEWMRNFKRAAQEAGVVKKSENTILEWAPPQRYHTDPALGKEGNKFCTLGWERYIEWRLLTAEEMKNPHESSSVWNLDWVNSHNGVEQALWHALNAWTTASFFEE